jgi:uncharacterized membrane protein YGL010W
MPDRMARGAVMSDVMVRARDGIGLATDVYLPDGAGPFPTVLTRLPYGKTEPYCHMPTVADLWNRRGYAAVVQDVRGKWGSEGVFVPNLARNEIDDGHDTIDWIARQPPDCATHSMLDAVDGYATARPRDLWGWNCTPVCSHAQVIMRTVNQWLVEYGESHRNPRNKALHWVCVPVIVWCIIGLLWSLPTPMAFRALYSNLNWACIWVVVALAYYAVLSLKLALGAAVTFLAMLWSIDVLEHSGTWPLWGVCVGLFTLAWVGQFIGHAIEGKRPSFFQDLQFLLIGPLWLLAHAYRRMGIRF